MNINLKWEIVYVMGNYLKYKIEFKFEFHTKYKITGIKHFI